MRLTSLVYLAGPVRAVPREDALWWRRQMAVRLYRMGVATFDPAAAWTVPTAHTDGVSDYGLEVDLQIVNDVAVAMSNALLVCYQGVDSKGTDREICLAKSLGKRIVVLNMYSSQGPAMFENWYRDRFWKGSWGNSQLVHPYEMNFDECASHFIQFQPTPSEELPL